MNPSQVIQRAFHNWGQKKIWSLKTYDPKIVGKIFYDRGHYLSAYRWFKLAESHNNIDKLEELPFQLDAPTQSVQKFLECHKNRSFSYERYWLAITEEALSYFATRSDHLNAGDAYQILKTSICPFVKLPQKTAERVTTWLDQIENSPEWSVHILAKRSQIRVNIHFIDELIAKLWEMPLIGEDMKCRVAYDYLNMVEYTFDVNSDRQEVMLLALYHDRRIFPPKDQAKIQLYVADQILSFHQSYPIDIDDIEKDLCSLQDTLAGHDRLECRWIRAKIALQKQSLDHPDIDGINLTDAEIATILKEVMSLERTYYSHRFFEIHLDQDKATLELVKMRLENRTDLITDVEAFQYLKDLKHHCGFERQVLPLMEQFYLQGRAPSYQRLTIANNTCSDLTFKVCISEKIEEFTLRETQQRRYDNLREKGITHVGIIVIRDGKIIVDQPYLDANSYVACYGDFKFTVYFEPDVSAESEVPTNEMIRQVADLLQHEYRDHRRSYPRSNLNDFIGELGCDLNPEHRSRDFTRTLHGLMRPKQLTTAIKMILEGDI